MSEQIYRIDEVLLKAGAVTGVLAVGVAALAIVSGSNDAAIQLGTPSVDGVAAVLLGLAPIVLLGAGWSIRRRERRIIGVWKILRDNVQVSARELAANSDFTRAELKDTVRILNTKGLGYYLWDDETDLISDGRLPQAGADVDRCPTCGAALGREIKASLRDSLRCPYCDTALPSTYHDHLKRQAFAQLRPGAASAEISAPAPRPLPRRAPPQVHRRRSRRFSLPVFILLLFIGWPFAIAYAIYKSRAAQFHRDELSGRSGRNW